MSKFIEIHSLNHDTIDEIIKRFEEYKKQYGGDCSLTVDTYVEDEYDGGLTSIYYGINTKEEHERD